MGEERGFTPDEWDEIAKLVSEKRREILTRINRVEKA
jgi:hypothetical protein